ncbi:MAG: protein kinase [Myxococcota bacterium]
MGTSETFGRYELIKLVGAGGMALVHLARQRGPEGFVKPCVLKRIAPDAERFDQVRQMFLEEARITALLNHPNIVQVFDYGVVDVTPYIALELIDGVNLAQFCRTLAERKRWLPLQPSVDICIRLLDALSYAHDLTDLDGRPLSLVHRDVSPQNTLLSRQGAIKLADFGIARHDARDASTRAGGTAKGKPGYMAPEQAMGEAVDARADLFSVGVILTELVSARRVMSKHQRPIGVLGIADRIRDLFDYRPEAPKSLRNVALRLCALDPEARPDNAAQAAAELRAAMANEASGLPLDEFLKQVFAQHIPESIQAPFEASASPAPSPQGALAAMSASSDPTVGHLPSSPAEPATMTEEEVRTAWAAPADAQPLEEGGTSHVYEDGWPAQFLEEKKPDLQLITRSATVDAMQYFAAQPSDEVRARDEHQVPATPIVQGRAASRGGAERPDPLAGATGPRSGGGARLTPNPIENPVHDRHLNKALDQLRAAPPPGTQSGDMPAVSENSKRHKGELPPVLPLALAGLLIVLVSLLVMASFSDRAVSVDTASLPESGQLTVTSVPTGAPIFIDNKDSGEVTPKTLTGLPLAQPLLVSVRLPDHRSTPRDLMLRIPVQTGQTSANFKLRPGRTFQLYTDPDGAIVTVNGDRLSRVTPVTLETIPFGQSATIAVERDGYLSHRFVLKSDASAEATVSLKLEQALEVDVLSEPPGGTVYIDGEQKGRSPIYEMLVPKDRRFRIVIKKPGFQRWSRRFRPKDVQQGSIVAELTALPLMKLPMSAKERSEARRLLREVSRFEQDIKKLKVDLRRAQYQLERLEANSSPRIGPLANAQRKVDLISDQLTRRQDALSDARSQRNVFRDQILIRTDMEN